MLSGQHEVCATSWWPRARAAFTWSSVVKAAVGLVLEWNRAAITTGRLASIGDLLEIGDRGLAALGQHVDAACRSRPSPAPACAARGRRPGATASACRPRRCAPRRSRWRSRRRRPPSPRAPGRPSCAISSSVAVRSVASSPITKVRMAEWPAKQATLGPTPCFCQHVEILREALEAPVDAGAQRVERHALDMRQVAHGEVAVRGLAGRDGEAAIAQDGRGDAERRRGIDEGIPGDLRVVMGVAVDDAGRQRQAVGLHRLLGGAELAARWRRSCRPSRRGRRAPAWRPSRRGFPRP